MATVRTSRRQSSPGRAATAAPKLAAAPKRENYQLRTLDRAVQLLNCFTSDQPELGVTELSLHLGMHKATVHRMLTALEQHGLMAQDHATEKYRLGLRLLELGTRVAAQLHLPAIARPVLKELVAETGETAHLVVPDQGEGLYLEKVESPRAFRMPSQVGRRLPLHCTGVGKAILAFMDDSEIERIIARHGLERFTEHTLSDVWLLKRDLAAIRQRGFALDDEEVELGLRCIGAPVLNNAGQVVGAISIAGPTARVTNEQVPRLAERVIAHAASISARMGYAVAGAGTDEMRSS